MSNPSTKVRKVLAVIGALAAFGLLGTAVRSVDDVAALICQPLLVDVSTD